MSVSTNKPTMLIYLGANAHDALERQLLTLSPDIRFIESAVYPEREPASLAPHIICFDANLEPKDGSIQFTQVLDANVLSVIETVMADMQLPLLWTRFNGKTRWHNSSEVKRFEVAYSLIKSAIATCQREKPSLVVFSYEPHMLPIYLFKKVCEAMGIKTCTMTVSPFNWRLCLDLANDHDQAVRQACQAGKVCAVRNESVSRFIAEKRSDYSVAKPFYEKRIQGGGLGKKLLYQLKSSGWWRVHKLIMGQMARKQYVRESAQRSELKGLRYVCVFLQLQPEQTTLPDGGLFVHHLFGIQMLYAALAPLGIALVVREHPATYEYAFDMKWRSRDFYSAIKRIGPHIYFDDLDADPYALIQNAVAVSAITGTVLLEGLLQGKPAIAFGKHPLAGHVSPSFVDKFADENDLREKITVALAQSPQAIAADVENYLHAVYPKTFGPADYVGNTKMSLDVLRQARYTALQQVVEAIVATRQPMTVAV